MLSRVSDVNMFITAWLSMPSEEQTRPISLVKVTLSACQELSVSFAISATGMLVGVMLCA